MAEAVEGEIGPFPTDLEEQSLDFVQGSMSALREQRRFVSEDRKFSEKPVSSSSTESDESVIESKANAVAGTILRSDINGDPDAVGVVFPPKESEIPFLIENGAWGFVRIGRDPDYVAMYVTGDAQEVRYVAEVDDIVEPDEANSRRRFS